MTGPGTDTLTIDAGSISQIFNVNDGDIETHQTVSLSDLTLANGAQTSGNGGAISTFETLTVTDVTVKNSQATGNGGGIYNVHDLTVTRSTVRGNLANIDGGGIYTSTLTGAIARITDSTIAGNTSGRDGGGVWNGSETFITASTLSGNSTTGNGGGIVNAATGTLTVTSSTLSGNTASIGGAIINSGDIELISSTIAINTATNQAGGIFNNDSGTTAFTSTIIAGNTAPSRNDLNPAGVFSGTHNLIGDPASSAKFIHGTNNNIVGQDDDMGGRELLDIATVLGPLKDNGGPAFTHALLEGSPAIDAGYSDLGNLASSEMATQSSTRTFPGFTLTADQAVDGDLSTFSHTDLNDTNAFWQVELATDAQISTVVLHNRVGFESRLRDITVEVLAADGNSLFTSLVLNPENESGDGTVNQGPDSLTVDVAALNNGAPVTGRIVRVRRTADPDLSGSGGEGADDERNVLSLTEVQVFATAHDQRGATFLRRIDGDEDDSVVIDIGAFEFEPLPRDYGDAPDTTGGTGNGNYKTLQTDDGPSHTILAGLHLGALVDGDDGTLQNGTASADDNFGPLRMTKMGY